jgi:GT2 family glycosyltransferase
MEYCRRVVRAGWKLLYTSDARIYHHEGKSAEQEAPAWMRMVTLSSVLRYLAGEPTRHPVALRRLFKTGYLAQVAFQAGESALKTVAYGIVGGRPAAEKHRRRCARAVRFLGYAARVARL